MALLQELDTGTPIRTGAATVTLTIDGRKVSVPPGTSVIAAAALLDNPIPKTPNVAAYWAAIQKNEHAAKTLAELHRGLEERREQIRSGVFQKMMATIVASHAAAEAAEAAEAANS